MTIIAIATTNVVANANGSVLERLEYIQTALATVDDFVDTEIAAIQAVTDALPDSGALTAMTAAVQAVYDRIAGTDSSTNVLGADDADKRVCEHECCSKQRRIDT